ncbi:ABC transporter permease [Clostridium beijerinckii]|uniref:ABC transporter permease subunit n=1 Tax=Clostridium beijerinckii TaxID=1520 RepID=A0A7X9XNF0_CLOBE|nr:ABC transporter permease subunit [Clostridium beijerinckii]NMF04189.1 ABC transporter permease subunit [Clostridium beijerinckii]
MLGLIKNEIAKIFSRKLTKILLSFLIIFSIGAAFFQKTQTIEINDWKSYETQVIADNKNRIELTNLSPQLKADAENKINISKYRLDNDIQPQKLNPWSASLNLTGLIEMIIIIVIILAAEIVSREFTDGTIKLLLIRPHNRIKILFSKYFSIIFFSVVALLLMLISQITTNGFLYGFSNLFSSINTEDIFIDGNGTILLLSVVMQLFKLYGLSLFSIMSYATFAFCISTLVKNSALAVGASLVFMIVGNSMIEAASTIPMLKYLPFANSDFSLYIYHLMPRPEMSITFSVVVLLIYMIILNVISCVSFSKRDIIL